MNQPAFSSNPSSQAVSDAAGLGASQLTPQSFGKAVTVALTSKKALEDDGTEINFSPVSRSLASTIYPKGLPSVAGASTQRSDAPGLWSVVIPLLAAGALAAVYFHLSRRKTTATIETKEV